MKTEILNDLKELKTKGINVSMHDSYIERASSHILSVNCGSFISIGSSISQNDSEVKVRILKKPTELTINIYLNSTEEEIKNQISAIKSHLKVIEEESKSSAIVDFLAGEGI